MDLEGRVALITGVSRQRGIGIAIARHLGQLGAQLFLHGFTAYDRSQPWGAEAEGTEALANQLQQDGITVAHLEANFLDADAPKKVMNAAVATRNATWYQNHRSLSTSFTRGLPSLNRMQLSKNKSVRRSSK